MLLYLPWARIVALMLKGPVQDRVNGLRSLLAHNPLVERDGIFAAGDLSGLQALLSTLVIGDAVQTLTALDLSHVSLGSDGLALVLAALNQGCAGGTPRAGTILSGTLGNGNALSVLDLRDNGLGEKGAMALVETIVPLIASLQYLAFLSSVCATVHCNHSSCAIQVLHFVSACLLPVFCANTQNAYVCLTCHSMLLVYWECVT